jgi:hypothetical protein
LSQQRFAAYADHIKLKWICDNMRAGDAL